MSWQAYVDTNLVGSKCVTKAAIVGLDGNKWAGSSGFNVTADEAKKLVAAFKDASAIRAGGLVLAGQKYFALKTDDRSIYVKQGSAGAICVKTGKAVLVGVYDDKIQPGQASTVVEKLADYLIEQGY
eukprot:TRINITY_DN298_c0_g1_i1.p2 TRINITY_DN298_c0_g1~~TRINITY_DN298_c0_g1_i1.p2  ORF type:complete len:127 (-),score=28.44 TRINITY_DN298_c0_g1_i1:178-558(-)